MKAWEVVGYVADATVWCVSCARRIYAPLTESSLDAEGNFVHPIFACDEWEEVPVCNCCHEPLIW